MPILCAQSLRLPSSKFKMPILCTQSLRLPSSKFKGLILSTQSLRLPSSKSKRPILCTQSLRLPSSKFRGQYFALNHCGCRPPNLKSRKRETAPQKKAIWEDEILPTWALTGAQRVARQSLGSSFCSPGH